MAETFVITVLSFALVLAVVAALLVWVILPALNEEDEESKTKELTITDYIDDINAINESAYTYDTTQQQAIDDNAKDIQELKDDLALMSTPATSTSTSTASDSGGAVSTATEASATFNDGVWTIQQGGLTFKATHTHMCSGDCDESSADSADAIQSAS